MWQIFGKNNKSEMKEKSTSKNIDKRKAIINVDIYDYNSYRKNCYIVFDSKILEIGEMKDFKGSDVVYDCKGQILMPGLLNCHNHIYSTFARGVSLPFNPRSFMDILNQMWWKLDSEIDEESIYYSTLVNGIESLKNGVTTHIDHHASGLCVKNSLDYIERGLCDDLGVRGILCFETSDRYSIEECINENMRFSKNRTEKCAGIFGMHASLSLSDHTLEKIKDAIGDTPIHVHVGESHEDEIASLNLYNMRVVERFKKFDLINKNSILAHCVHINEKEAEIIKDCDAYIAVNPTSNMNNSVGVPNILKYKKYSIPCIIGTDGLGTNIAREYLNTVYTMKMRYGNPTKFGLDELLTMINNGYDYVSNILNIKLGRIEKGYESDFITVPYKSPTEMNETNVLAHIFYGVFDNFKPKNVWCSGKQLVSDYNLCISQSEEEIYKRAAASSKKLWDRLDTIHN